MLIFISLTPSYMESSIRQKLKLKPLQDNFSVPLQQNTSDTPPSSTEINVSNNGIKTKKGVANVLKDHDLRMNIFDIDTAIGGESTQERDGLTKDFNRSTNTIPHHASIEELSISIDNSGYLKDSSLHSTSVNVIEEVGVEEANELDPVMIILDLADDKSFYLSGAKVINEESVMEFIEKFQCKQLEKHSC